MNQIPTPSVITYDRYGGRDEHPVDVNLPDVVKRLIAELGDEQFSRPDEEHYSVSLGHDDGWNIEVNLYGLLQCGELSAGSDHVEYFAYGLSVEELEQRFLLVAHEEIDELMNLPWTTNWDELPAWERPFYLYAACPDRNMLHRVAPYGDVEWAREVIQNGVDINGRMNFRETPLHLAALAAHFDMCKFLIEAGAEINAADHDGATPLDYAIDDDWEFDGLGDRIRQLLIQHGARAMED